MSTREESIDPAAVPSGTGCLECEQSGGWWVHLRRCALCGHIGCCDSSPSQHASAHWKQTGHRVSTSFEPGEDWFWDFEDGKGFLGPQLAPPRSRPVEQASPGPADRLPDDWQDRIHT